MSQHLECGQQKLLIMSRPQDEVAKVGVRNHKDRQGVHDAIHSLSQQPTGNGQGQAKAEYDLMIACCLGMATFAV